MTDAWSVQVTGRFRRDLHRLPDRVAAAVVEFVTEVLPTAPGRMSKPLQGELEGLRSARRGDYRVLLQLDDDARTVLLLGVAHRAHAYRPR